MSAVRPQISIITISYNQRRYLEQALDSVLSQLQPDVEYVVFDGGSTDGSEDLIASRSDAIAYWQSCPDGGPASALQQALDRCSGEYFMYLNSDDFLLPGAITVMRAAIRAFPEIDVFYGNGMTLDERNRTWKQTFSDRWNAREYALGAVSIFQQGCAIRRDFAKRVGGFNSANTTCWDGELLFDLSLAGAKFKRLRDMIAVFRLHEESISGSGKRQSQYYSDRTRMARKIGINGYREPNVFTSVRKAFRQPEITIQKLISRFSSPQSMGSFETSPVNDKRSDESNINASQNA